MSHVATINIIVKDLAALRTAAEMCGLRFVEGQKTYKWFGRHVGDYPIPEGLTLGDMGKCDHALVIPGNKQAYEIGIKKRADGKGYHLLWDFWQGGYGLQDRVGKGGKKLVQEYARAVSRKHLQKMARKRGLRVTEKREGSRIILTMGR